MVRKRLDIRPNGVKVGRPAPQDSTPALGRRAVLGGAAGVGLLGLAPPAASAGRDLRSFKCSEFIRRAPGLSREAFADHWRRVRAPMMRRLPGLERLVFNLVDPVRSTDTTYDAVVELWFANAAAYDRAFDGPHAEVLEALARDASAFMQPDFLGLFTREVVIRDPRPGVRGRAKRIGLVGRQPGMDQATFFRLWRDEHAAAADRAPGMERYVLNMVDRQRFPDAPWDGYAELWWTDWPTYTASMAAIRTEAAARSSFFHSHQLLLVDEID